MIQVVYDVAFSRNVEIHERLTRSDTIDAKFGVYNGMLSISLSPSNNPIDWSINLEFFTKKVKPYYAKGCSEVRIHQGYISEWEIYRDEFFKTVNENSYLSEAIKNGLVVSGRSKGGAEASIVALDFVRNYTIPKDRVYVGMLEAPKIGNLYYKLSVEKYIPKEHLYWVQYKRDLITMFFLGLYSPGNLIKFGKSYKPFSILNHSLGCFDEDKMYTYVEKYDKGLNYDNN